jgi:tagatose 1,6-diphosphate aldolase GatY/KbaY
VTLCLVAARHASVPISVHLDHSRSKAEIQEALRTGFTSIMADGSHLPYGENVAFTREMVTLVHKCSGMVEA